MEENLKDRENLEQIGSDDGQIAKMIIDKVEESLRDINARQNRILSNRGELSDVTILEIQNQVLATIKGFQNGKIQIEEKGNKDIFELFEQDDRTLRDVILEKYEEYMQNKSQSEIKKSEASMFRDSLNAGISLEEQFKSAKQFHEKQEEQDTTDKPKLLVDELPDLFL